MSISIGVVGFGRMAQAIIYSLIESGKFTPDEIFAVVGSRKSIPLALEKFPLGIQVVSSDDSKALDVWNAPIKILAVKPQQLPLVEQQFFHNKNQLNRSQSVLVSLLAGVRLKKLQDIFSDYYCVRAVPNTPIFVGAGLTGLSWGESFPDDQKIIIKDIFALISEIIEFPEEQLDAFLALTSSGPAYVALIVEALADGAVAAGLPRSLSLDLAQKMLAGSVLLLQKKKLHPGELKDMVSSPAGTTIRAVRHLEQSSLRSALIEAVVLAANRSRELG